MELYQLKTFAMVAKEGHLTRAAEKLNTSQPAVSAHVKALEAELGLTLFLRSPKGMQLTAEGRTLYQKTLDTLATLDELRHQARRMQTEIRGTIRLGLHIDPAYLHLDALLSEMRQKHMEVEFHLLQRHSWEQPQDIRKGILDAGFIYDNGANDGLVVIPLERLPVRIVAPLKWQARLNSAGWREIAKMPWIWCPAECNFGRLAANAFAKRKLRPFKVAVADQEPAVSALVSSGVGLGLMMEKEALNLAEKKLVSIWKESVGEVDLCFVYAARRKSDPLILALLEIIRQIWQ